MSIRKLRSAQVAAGVVALVAAVPAASASAAASPADKPVATAFINGKSAAVRDALKKCTGDNCTFSVTAGPQEFMTAVTTVGSAVINCGNTDMTVTRTVTLTSQTSDNVGGEISGSSAKEGTVTNTIGTSGTATLQQATSQATTVSTTDTTSGTVTGSGTTSGTKESTDNTKFNSFPKDKGPNTETLSESKTSNTTSGTLTNSDTHSVSNTATNQLTNTTTATGSVTGSESLSTAAKAAFQSAFKSSAGTTLTQSALETMTYTTVLKPKDVLALSAQNAMVRTTGTLNVNEPGGKASVENITVDSPSTVNSSNLVAQTFTDAKRCDALRPTASAVDPEPSRGMSAGLRHIEPASGLHEIARPDGKPNKTTRLFPHRTTTK